MKKLGSVQKKIRKLVLAISVMVSMAVTSIDVQAAECNEKVLLQSSEQRNDVPEELEVVLSADTGRQNQSQARTMMVDCYISICSSEAGMHIEISTCTVDMASVLGVKDIKIMKKVWYGWKTVATSNGGEVYNNYIKHFKCLQLAEKRSVKQ